MTRGVLSNERRTVLLWIDALGQEERAFSEAANQGSSALLSPDDVAVSTRGEVFVVDATRHTVVVFGSTGTLLRIIDLTKAWGREPRYSSGIAPDVDGGFIVEDFAAAVPFVRMRADGSVVGELKPRYADGRPTGRLWRLRAAHDGGLWGSDGEALLRFDDDGVVERALGSQPSTQELGEVAALTLGPGGRIFAADRRTGAVHVFDPNGVRQNVYRPDPDDVTGALESPSLTVTDDDRIYLRAGDVRGAEGGFIEFSATGERIARHAWEDQARFWNPATGGFWAIRHEDVGVVDAGGIETRSVTRRADRTWLDWVAGAVAAADGSIAVAAEASDSVLGSGPQEWALNLYSADGTPIRMIRLPAPASREHFAYDGRRIALWQSGEVRILDSSGEPLGRFKPRVSGAAPRDWPLLISEDGCELWMFEQATKLLHRYEMP
jgi:hypothetical protein